MTRAAAAMLFVGLAIAALLGVRGSAAGDGRARPPVSVLVYPREARVLRVNHGHPAHAVLRCERCHEGASRDPRGRLPAPAKETCVGCHPGAAEEAEASEEVCGMCHLGFALQGAGVAPRVAVARRERSRLTFSHAAHARAGVRCLSCHDGIDEEGDSGWHLPTMESCHRCHGGPSPTATSECTACHERLGDGRMRSAYPEGWMNPPRWLRGLHHGHEWLVRHRWVAADQGSDCATCHVESECAACHDGRVRPNRLHPNDFLTTHPQLARRAGNRCASCHATQDFCAECHSRLGLASFSAPAVRVTERYHPPDDVWIRGPALHGREARRSMNDCVSCHSEQDCVSCHGAFGVGAGISPHPPGFVETCARALSANARACRTCHGDLATVRALCR